MREGWNFKGEGSDFEPALDKLAVRAREARKTLREIATGLGDDAHIAVVSHGAFLHFLTEEWHGITNTYRKMQPLFALKDDRKRKKMMRIIVN